MSVSLDQEASSYFAVQGLQVPKEGPRAIPLLLNFGLTTQFTLNLQNVISRGFISMVQALWIDNSQNSEQIQINFPNTQQTIRLEAGEQGYVNCLCPNPAQLSFSSISGDNGIVIHLLNYPVTNAVWQTTPSANTVNQNVTYSAGILGPALVANETLADSATDTVSDVVTGAPGYYVAGISVQLTSDATLTAGTDLQITLTDSSSGAVAVLNLSPGSGLFGAILGFFWNNKVSDSTLTITFSTSLSAGNLFYTLNYGISETVF